MSTATVQPIAGVSASKEAEIEAVYQSIASGFLGGIIGSLMGPIAGLPLLIRIPAYLVVGGVLALPAIVAYALAKIFGNYYVLTNRSVIERKLLGGAMIHQVTLAEIDDVEVIVPGSYEFFGAADVNLLNAQGAPVMTLRSVPNPQRFRQIIIDARNARTRSDESLKVIQARG